MIVEVAVRRSRRERGPFDHRERTPTLVDASHRASDFHGCCVIILVNGREYWSSARPETIREDLLEIALADPDGSYRRLNYPDA